MAARTVPSRPRRGRLSLRAKLTGSMVVLLTVVCLIVGVVSERDLVKRVVAEGRDPATTRVGDIMNADIVKVLDSSSVESAARAMRARHVRHAVIVDAADAYRALLSERHLLYDVMSALEAKVGDLTGYLMTDGPGG